MDDANKKLENGLEPIYDHVRRPFKRLYLNRAVTQNYLQPHDKSISDIPQGEIQHQVDNSYALVLKGITKAQKHSLETTYSCEQLYGF